MSGSNSYTKEEVQTRIEQLRAGAITLDRNKVQSATDLVTGVQDLIYRTLNSDIDSVYALLKLFSNGHIILTSRILYNLDLLERYAPVARQASPTPDSSKLTRLTEISEELEFAGAGEREALLREFLQVTESLTKSSTTSTGFQNPGVSPTYAREQSIILAEETEFLIKTLVEKIPNFQNALTEYSAANLESLSLGNQAKKAAGILKGYENQEDISSAILDSVIFATLLNNRAASKRGITTPKFEGTVDTLPGAPAELLGGTKPFIIQDAVSSADFSVDSSSSATVSGAQSDAAELSVLKSPQVFSAREEYGELHTQTADNATGLERWFSSSGLASGATTDDAGNLITTIPYTKSVVRPSEGGPDFEGGASVDFSYKANFGQAGIFERATSSPYNHSYVEFRDPAIGTDDFTISFWMKADNTTDTQHIFEAGGNTLRLQVYPISGSPTQINLLDSVLGASSVNLVYWEFDFYGDDGPSPEYFHWVITRTAYGSSGYSQYSLYFNGTYREPIEGYVGSVSTKPYGSWSPTNITSGENWRIGTRLDNSEALDAEIDEFCIQRDSAYPLGTREIVIQDRPFAVGTGEVLFHFDGDVFDHSFNGNNGTANYLTYTSAAIGSGPEGPSVVASCVDNGLDGRLLNKSLITANSHGLAPDLPFNGTVNTYSFTGAPGFGSLIPVVDKWTGSIPVSINLEPTFGKAGVFVKDLSGSADTSVAFPNPTLGTDDFTVTFWMKSDNASNTQEVLTGASTPISWSVTLLTNPMRLTLHESNTASSSSLDVYWDLDWYDGGGTSPEYFHWAITRKTGLGSTTTFSQYYLHFGGSYITPSSGDGSPYGYWETVDLTDSVDWVIGKAVFNYPLDARIAEFSIQKTAIYPSSADITVPSGPILDDTGEVLFHFDDDVLDYSSSGDNDGTASNLSYVQSGILGSTIAETWTDVSNELAHTQITHPGYYELTPQSGSLGSTDPNLLRVWLNYDTGHVYIDLGGFHHLRPSDTITVNSYNHRPNYGVVDYDSGHLLVKMPGAAALDSILSCSYGYYPLGNLKRVNTTPGTYPPTMTSFGSIGVFSGNTLTTETLADISPTVPYPSVGAPSEWVTSGADLGDYIQATNPAGWGFSHEVDGVDHRYNFSSNLRGSMARVALLNSTNAELNTTTALAPTWTINPSDLNQAISALYSSYGEKFGADTQFSSITSSSASISLTCPENTLFKNVPITEITYEGGVLAIDLTQYGLSAGDNLHVRFDGTGTGLSRTTRSFHTKVTGIDLGEGEVAVDPPVSLPLDDWSVGALSMSGTWTCDVSRSPMFVRSANTASDSSLLVDSVAGDGLGFEVTDTADGFSNIVKLLVDIHGTRPRYGYEIHPNDVVLESYVEGLNTVLRFLGHVLSVDGEEVSIALASNIQPKVYPYKTLKIVPLGWYQFMKVAKPLGDGLTSLRAAIGEGDLTKSTNVFAESGSGQVQYMSLLQSLKAAVDEVRLAYLLYSTHTVRTVDELLATLKQEKLSLPLDMLMTARFKDLAEMTVSEVSDQTNIDNILLAAFEQLGGETSFFEISNNADTIESYYSSGEDDKYDPEMYPDNAGDLL
ncbi:MAG: hypothetical protein CL582_23365 [Alteromonadaceae bacterium]|nr:hypothetical protein [Alteromonadaceae bacterium]